MHSRTIQCLTKATQRSAAAVGSSIRARHSVPSCSAHFSRPSTSGPSTSTQSRPYSRPSNPLSNATPLDTASLDIDSISTARQHAEPLVVAPGEDMLGFEVGGNEAGRSALDEGGKDEEIAFSQGLGEAMASRENLGRPLYLDMQVRQTFSRHSWGKWKVTKWVCKW